MDIRAWLKGPKGLKKVEKDVKPKKHSKLLDSDSEDEKIPKERDKISIIYYKIHSNPLIPVDFFCQFFLPGTSSGSRRVAWYD